VIEWLRIRRSYVLVKKHLAFTCLTLMTSHPILEEHRLFLQRMCSTGDEELDLTCRLPQVEGKEIHTLRAAWPYGLPACLPMGKQDRKYTYSVTLRCFRESFLPWKSSKYCACVRACVYVGTRAWTCTSAYVHVVLLIQHAMRMLHIVTSSVAPSVCTLFLHIIH
jgi:hypothetical protein